MSMGNITDLIKNVAANNQIIETFAAKVIEINTETASLHHPEDAYTVNVMRADGAIIKNVRLKASIQDLEQGMITIPKKDSWVLASVIDGIETRAFISQFSEIERTFIRFKNDQDRYLEIDTQADQFKMVFKEKEVGQNGTPSTTKPTYKNRALIKFSDQKDSSISTAFFDENGKEISKNSFNIKEHNISINEGKTIFSLKDKEAKITINDGFQAVISDSKTSFIKDNLTFEMDSKFKISVGEKNLLTQLQELIDEICKITVTTAVGPSGTPINLPKLNEIKGKFSELLKS